MKLTCCGFVVAGLIVATMSITASSYAQSTPRVQSPAPEVGMSPAAPSLPQPNAATPDAVSPSSGINLTAPLAEPRHETLEDCMSFWDAGTHMSKTEWREACKRTLNGRDF